MKKMISTLSVFSMFSLMATDVEASNRTEEKSDTHTAPRTETFDPIEFVKTFVPEDSTEDYIEKVASCYRDAMTYKQEIMHDNRPVLFGQSMILPNTVTKDYGWNFPPVPRVQRHLLEFCAQATSPLNMMDIGAGYGIDSLFALLTKKIKNLYALENQKAQSELLKQVVEGSIRTNVDSAFPLSGFKVFKKDFLTLAPDFSRGAFNVLNANKVIHFFDPAQIGIFSERANSLLKKGGRLFLTCLTPSPGSEIEDFMKEHEGEDLPGFVFYKQETMLIHGSQPGESRMLEVRAPREGEESAHFFQRVLSDRVITDRVMHYHTLETITKVLGDGFRILETMITTPDENHGTDHMISIVAEKQ